ncbi:GTPase HflX [Mobiluncus curtisii]|uniref:GTPase HflX n=1 Tax=Mobiluncus curtisii TaxID=2051 RepID=UPI0014700EFF|nr:GTPase HflX [Mobiluncus curtisii]NMW43016.1 GTPase HflX [Mobiluncus curtisii]NMW83640.1 GTPase HflX [Mobiluncus curtisii]NMW99603.1 GTPase HflX [Mobiluncus curtisii]NMX04870.1 GTPase HflX [Mobiluncus curtisii]
MHGLGDTLNSRRKDYNLQENTEDYPNLDFLSPAAVPPAGGEPESDMASWSQLDSAEQAQRWADRYALGRVESIGSELQDISEVEYREVRLEKVIVVGIFAADRDEAELSLQELAALAKTAGAVVLAGLLQRRDKPDVATFLGRGKAHELQTQVATLGADTVIVDDELAPSQRRALEDVVKVKVIDRTALILDIFAQHATSREGKAQVELAQLEYLLPRLRGWGESMSRQAGGRAAAGDGIGARGPGETKIELDRRRIRSRMARLRRNLKALAPTREAKRASRKAGGIPAVAIVGYTNAGKSSLLNRLAGANLLVHDALFATLDPSVRRANTPEGREYTLADTVGFVRRLPTELVEAFRSTLEETAMADLILHVVDGSNPDPMAQVAAVDATLELVEGIEEIPVMMVVNKIDQASAPALALLRHSLPEAYYVSARNGEGIEALQQSIADRLPWPGQRVRVVVKWENTGLLERIYRDGKLLTRQNRADGTFIDAWVPPALGAKLLNQAMEDDCGTSEGDDSGANER